VSDTTPATFDPVPIDTAVMPVDPGKASQTAPTAHALKKQILALVGEYYAATVLEQRSFVPGRSPVRYAGRVYDEAEMHNLIDASLDFWLTEGRYAQRLETALARFLGVEFCRLVNSGSSANLVAFSALTSARLGDRRIEKGDEVITVAAGFPTTVAPIIQYGAVPVFIDVDAATANADMSMLEAAYSARTKAVMFAHTLGNPFNLDAVLDFCRRHGLWLIEDNCDALGSRYTTHRNGLPETHFTGSFGDLATSSFYPPHHMTTGEGGAVYSRDAEIDLIAASFRDWGRDCYCKSGKDNTCGLRFQHQLGELPFGYDHKYTYSHFGYNLKMTDLQAAVGLAQIGKVPEFGKRRRENFAYLNGAISEFSEVLDIVQATPNADPSWFGMLMTVREDAPFSRADIVDFLESRRVQTRMLFAGNLLRHPCFDELREAKTGFRVVGELTTTDRFMERAFWIGVYPGMGSDQLEYMADQIGEFCKGRKAVK
jgi:CDP-6-deoxy-D-xylo-4-hexulose-3-dehydrase